MVYHICDIAGIIYHLLHKTNVMLNPFKEVDIVGKVTIKMKLCKIAYLYMTLLCALVEKFKTEGLQKKLKTNRFARSTKA